MTVQAGKDKITFGSGRGEVWLPEISRTIVPGKASMLFPADRPVDYPEITIQGGAPDGIGAGMTIGAKPHIVRGLGAVRGAAPIRLPVGADVCALPSEIGSFVAIGGHQLGGGLAPEAEMAGGL